MLLPCGVLTCVLFVSSACLRAQAPSPQPEVRLEPHDGKTSFQIGEPVQLDLVLSNQTGTPMMVNGSDYGDNSDPVRIVPATGWIAWQGQSGHDYASVSALGPKPFRIPIRVDQAAIFRQPGHYQVSVTESRVQAGGDLMHMSALPPVTTNSVDIAMDEMTAEREAEIVHGVIGDLANATQDRAGNMLRYAAVRRLAALQGDGALEEKVHLLIAQQEDFRGVETEAWATTRNIDRQMKLLEQAWHDPRLVPAYDMPGALEETRRLLAGRPIGGWQFAAQEPKPDAVEQQLAAAHQQDMLDLLNSVPQRSGVSRRYAAYYLVEFRGLPQAEEERAREYAVEEFAGMDDVAQHMVLETARPPVRDRRMIPALRALLAARPADKDALAAFLDIDPEEATSYAVRAICAPGGPPLIDAFAKIKADRLPEVDACLRPLLEAPAGPAQNSGRDTWIWQQRVVAAARFATPALLPAIEQSGTNRDGSMAGAMLAAEMRDDPAKALDRLAHATVTVDFWFNTNKVYESAHQPFPPAVTKWLRDRMSTGLPDDAGRAAYELSVGGRGEDRAAIEQRLAALRVSPAAASDRDTATAEVNLVSALLHATAWTLTPEERARITDACISEECHRFRKQ